MNCTTCRMELSRCLDGRLPSGRHATVMAHAEGCPECSQFWQELQEARKLALRAPKLAVSDDFHDGLWQRIRAGEGTPEAVFREPVSTVTKLRYLGTGAAAAAAMLFVARHFAAPAAPAPASSSQNVAAASPEGAGSVEPATADREQPRVSLASFGQDEPLQPFEPDRLAMAAASNVSQTHHDLDLLLCSTDPRESQDETRALAQVEAMHEMGTLLLELHDEDFIGLDPRAQTQLARVVYQIDPTQLRALDSARDVLQSHIRPLIEQTRDLRELPRRVKTAHDRERFFRQLQLDRELARTLSANFLVVPVDSRRGEVRASWSATFEPRGRIIEPGDAAGQLFFINWHQLNAETLRSIDARLSPRSIHYSQSEGQVTIQICTDGAPQPAKTAPEAPRGR